MDVTSAQNHEWVQDATILRVLVGSSAHGLALEGTDDRDEIGVCIEPLHELLKLGQPFEQYIFRTATERTGKLDAPSQVGDLDLTIFSLQKFCRLAAAGNPTILNVLFAKPITHNALGSQLQSMAPVFVSKEAGNRYLGYMQSQRQRLLGERGQKRVKRQDLVDRFGYDTKYAMHILRLGMQGIELLRTGHLTLPMQDVERQYLMQVRRGEAELNAVLTRAGELERELKHCIQTTQLPDCAQRPDIEAWMQSCYLETWKASAPHYNAKWDGSVHHPEEIV